MRRLHLLRSLSMGLFLGVSYQAVAQEDIPYFRDRLQRAVPAAPVTHPRANRLAAGRTTSGSCDLSTNGNFETQLQVPSHLNNIGGGYGYTGSGATNAPDQLANWFSPTGGSPDYWAENAVPPSGPPTSVLYPESDMRPSQAVYGPFSPHSPDGVVGLYYNAYSNTAAEYIRTSITPLTAGTPYYIEYWVSLSQNRNACSSAIKQNFGFALGQTTLTQGRPFLPPPSNFYSSGRIDQNNVNYGPSGSGNWKRIGQVVTGNNEGTITFGMFSDNAGGNTADFESLPDAIDGDAKSYVLLDDVAIYKIPTAGPATSVSCNQDVIIGQGCPIPGATYAWTILNSSAPPFAYTLQTPVQQDGPTTYVLTVTLPNNSTSVSTVYVSGSNRKPAYPLVRQDDPENWRNKNQAQFFFLNHEANTTYHVNNVLFANPTAQPNTNRTDFIVKGGYGNAGDYYGYFTITATNLTSGCSVTTDTLAVEYRIGLTPGGRLASAGTGPADAHAYPNPATERIVLPTGSTQVQLLDLSGKVVQQVEQSETLDVQQVPNGLYNLQLWQYGRRVNQRIQIQH